jgi:hypothetical protein
MKKQNRVGSDSVFPEALQQRLNSYALMAGAAGVSLLALTSPSTAEIVYTKTHQVIGVNSSYGIDFNHDGTIDLTIQDKTSQGCFDGCNGLGSLLAVLPGTNEVVDDVYGAVAMKPGMRIGQGDPQKGGTQFMAFGSLQGSFPGGSWVNVNNRYLGLKFSINGETHYGWARLSVQAQVPMFFTATLTGYAYETIPNKAIVAGQTREGNDVAPNAVLNVPAAQSGTLGMLALGKK